MIAIRRILVAVDFSSDSRAALECAIMLGDKLGASVTVLHTWRLESSRASLPFDALAGIDAAPLEELARIEAQRELDAVLALEQPAGRRIPTLLEQGEPAPVIMRVAREGGYDLVVLGARGRSETRHALLGSVTERVVRHAGCAVLAVRAGGSQQPERARP
jgi:nucleotide-binding universal stress UspA family protein